METKEGATLTIPEVSRLLRISRAHAYQLASEGRLGVPVLRLGRAVRVSRGAVERLLQTQTSTVDGDDRQASKA
jgi:excisionase family DNA binding protein